MRNKKILILLVVSLSFIVGTFLYPMMPEEMVSHWNSEGIPDDSMSKFWGLFLMPIVSLIIFLMFIFIPRIDPLKKNIEKFRGYFENLILVIILFLFYIYSLTLLWNLNYRFDMTAAIIPAIGLFIFYTGTVLERAKRNWFIGIRTPWTLSSDEVWDKTNKLGGKIFKAVGIISLLGIVFADYAIYIFLAPLLSGVFYVMVYSYFEYQKFIKGKEEL